MNIIIFIIFIFIPYENENYLLLFYFSKEIMSSNIPESIRLKLDRKLHNQTNHPIEILKRYIYEYFQNNFKEKFDIFDDLSPIVTLEDNFDKLLIPTDHPSRSKSDTYYVDDKHVLRTHTSAHQNELLSKGYRNFLVTGDVYRKDEIDSRHYPIFHQMEGVMILNNKVPEQYLSEVLSGLITHLFPQCQYRFNPDYFPFTLPSYEVEVNYKGNWIEVLGCGVIQPKILENNGLKDCKGIAWGLGLDRLCMIFCDIPDIRYLWSKQEKFLNQYADGKIKKFQAYSQVSSQTRDISFYLSLDNDNWKLENRFFELLRETADDLIGEVKLIDCFYNKKSNKHSRTYRITYSSNDPELKDPAEMTKLATLTHSKIRECISKENIVELR